jgi:hypothetical protein
VIEEKNKVNAKTVRISVGNSNVFNPVAKDHWEKSNPEEIKLL